jgi:hypothetical protein
VPGPVFFKKYKPWFPKPKASKIASNTFFVKSFLYQPAFWHFNEKKELLFTSGSLGVMQK